MLATIGAKVETNYGTQEAEEIKLDHFLIDPLCRRASPYMTQGGSTSRPVSFLCGFHITKGYVLTGPNAPSPSAGKVETSGQPRLAILHSVVRAFP